MKYWSLFFGILNLGCMRIGSELWIQTFNLIIGTACLTIFVYMQNKEGK